MGEHELRMREALQWAERAQAMGEVPVGAVAWYQGQVVGAAHNRREVDRSPLAHAELLALEQAAKALGAWRLTGVSLYVTLEPCPMCAGALVQARVSTLVFGAHDPKAGAAGSLMNLVQDTRLNHRVEVVAGVLEQECSEMLSGFFRGLRRSRLADDK